MVCSGGSVSKLLLYTLVKIYAVMSREFKNILNVPCLSGDLEGKVKWLDNFQKCRHLQEIIVWPPLWDRDKRFFIPEVQKGSIGTYVWHSTRNTLDFTKFPPVHLDIKSSFMSKNYSFYHVALYMGRLTSSRHSWGVLLRGVLIPSHLSVHLPIFLNVLNFIDREHCLSSSNH